jgi:hypothetical protein
MSGSATKADRGKTQIEVTVRTRQRLRLLAALTNVGMAEAADFAISVRLAEVQGGKEAVLLAQEAAYDRWITVAGKSLGEVASDAYDRWIAGPAGDAFSRDTAVRIGFMDGFIAALVMPRDTP